jgi:hypothetical protein
MTSDNKPNAATQLKKRLNAIHYTQIKYTQIKVSVDPSVADAFRKACAAADISMSANLTGFMTEYSNTAQKRKTVPDYSTRRQRRAAMRSIVLQTERIRAAEERYRDNIPENLQGSVVFEKADECVSLLEEVIELMDSVY